MREIKFRAWNVATKTMVDLKKITPLALNMDTEGLFIPFSDGLPVMQYTGMKDKKDKEIYEGDIVQYFDKVFTPREVFSVDFVNGMFYYKSIENEEYNNMMCDLGPVEIIGNIYENPELLEVKP